MYEESIQHDQTIHAGQACVDEGATYLEEAVHESLVDLSVRGLVHQTRAHLR